MSGDREVLEKTAAQALSGEGAHVVGEDVLEGLDWEVAGTRPEGAPYSIFQLLNHIIYWQAWAVMWLDGEDPPLPEHAAGSWPGDTSPTGLEDWEQATARFGTLRDELRRRVGEMDLVSLRVSVGSEKSVLGMLQTIGSHDSYHLGQVVLLRRMLGAWPPPSGGLTW